MINPYLQFDLSGGVQDVTSWLIKKSNEVTNVRNGTFSDILGAVVRRYGNETVGSAFSAGADTNPMGGHVARFSTGTKRFVAVHADDGLSVIVRAQNSGTGAWTTVITGLPADAQIYFFDYLDEVYVTGYDPATNTYITPRNIDKTLDVSTTRNILNMPKCKKIVEYLGALYAVNCEVNSVRYPDRAYKSSGPLGAMTFIQGAQEGGLTTLAVDSARYIKTGMALDIYAAGTDTKLYDLTVTSVDKVANTFDFSWNGYSTFNFATTDVNTGTEVITVPNNSFSASGTPVKVTSTTTVPGGLTSGTIYYVIYLSATTIKLATTEANATAGTAINLTSTGTGTHTMHYMNVEVSDNDEVWLDGRKNKLTMFWNTDYPTPEDADYLAVQPGAGSSNEIVAATKSGNRLFLFTKGSAAKYDGGQLVTFNNTVGCISDRSLCNIDDDWMIWLDANGHVWARNEASGQQQKISRGMYRNLLKLFTQDSLEASSAVTYNNFYKLYLGTVNGENIRIVYGFDDNTWTIESVNRKPIIQMTDDYTGHLKPYFLCDDGKLYIDETGNLDGGKSIPFVVEYGRSGMGSWNPKRFDGILIFSQYAIGAKVMASVDGGDFRTVGQIDRNECYVQFPQNGDNKLPVGYSVNIKISDKSRGDPQIIEGIVVFPSVEESNLSARQKTV
jgi:hypothetical protein